MRGGFRYPLLDEPPFARTAPMNASLILAVVWCGALGILDAMVLPGFVKQLRASDFPTTSGRIIRSIPKAPPRVQGKRRYRWTIVFRYSVDGQEWTGEQVSFGTVILGNGSRQAHQLTAEFPVGKEVTVFYNPSAPGQAVLRPGFLPDHLLAALFLTPFHVIGAGLLLAAVGPRLRKRPGPALRPIDDLRMSARMPWLAPWVVGMVTLGVATFVSLFVVAFALPQPISMVAATSVWGVVLAVVAFMASRRRAQLRAGLADLTIDAGARTVTLPLGSGRKERMTIPFTEIHGVSFRRLPFSSTRTTKGGWTVTEKRSSPRFELALLDLNAQRIPLAESGGGEELRALAEALHDTFGWPLAGPMLPEEF
jgi:hypothetical protein